MAEKKSYRDQVVEELLGHIEAGTAPWQKPWEPGKVRMAPFNPVSGKDYRGINALWLEMRGRSDPRWMTYRQAAAQDAQVRKGEKGTMIEYWKWSEREKVLDDNGKPVLDEKGVAKTRDVRLERPRVFHAVVFNAEQIDGLAPYIAPEPTFSPVERAEQILKQSNVPIFHDQNDRAFYRSSTDQIHMPHQAAFKGQYEYYATALHELGHATGHGSRMAREFGPFGSEVYAKEELRAEIASYMLTTELGLGHYPERHAAYVGSWMKAIKEDRNALFAAARDAENIRTWIMEPEMRQSLTPIKQQSAEKSQSQSVSKQQSFVDSMAEKRQRAIEKMFEKHPSAHPTLWAMRIQDSLVLTGSRQDTQLLPANQFKERLLSSYLSTDHLVRFLRQSAEMANWNNMAYSILGPDGDHKNFTSLAERFGKIDWSTDNNGPSDPLQQSVTGKNAVLTDLATEAARSSKHQELLSALWDIDGPQTQGPGQKPDWYIPAQQRADGLLRRLTTPFDLKANLKPEQDQHLAPDQKEATTSLSQVSAAKRIYLNVPFSEKDEAKALGAKWDRRAKAWYARDDMELEPFKRWQETKAKAPEPKITPEDEFAQALKENGLILDGPPTMDGKWHRVAVEGDRKGQKSGSYRGFLEGLPAGNITNYKSGQDPVKWVATGTKIDPKELEQSRAEAAARKAAQEQELRAQYRAVAKRAYGIFQNAEPAPANHPYLQNKQVPAGDLRIDQSGNLLMPMANDKGFVENIQTIHPDGTKMYLKDGKKRGLMHVIEGDPKGPMIISEGYSTGQSLHMASGLTVVVALDSGNIAPVAEALHKKHPDRALVIAADDDHAKQVNAGIKGAERASELTGAKILRPDLSDDEKTKGLTDFNDIHRERGIEALKRFVTEQISLTKPKSRTRTRGREQQAASLAV